MNTNIGRLIDHWLIFFTYFNNLFLVCNLEAADETNEDCESCEQEESKLPLQLAFVGRPNVGKSTLLNAILQEDRVLVGPEAGLTRDSIRVEFEFEGRTIYMVFQIFKVKKLSLYHLNDGLLVHFVIYKFKKLVVFRWTQQVGCRGQSQRKEHHP